MEFEATTLPGVMTIRWLPHRDERGYLIRTYCEREFQDRGLNTHWPQCNLSWTKRRGMLRGLHYQAAPCAEAKLITCVTGRIWDVIVDVRPVSATFGWWQGFDLDSSENVQLYVPAGYAHGFQCLTDDVRMFYQMSEPYNPAYQRGVRWDDPILDLPWPIADPEMSDKDKALPLLHAAVVASLD